MPTKDPLPPKENALFKKILKCYEQKQYKNVLKYARQILSNPKFAEHGETLAMKGLTLNCMGKKEEAYDHARRGLRNDLQSHVCWHVFGLIQRSDRKYDEAIKAYRNALRWDKDNLQILRDLSLLQIQMRDYDGYKETRYRLLELRPGQRASWIGYAMAFHLLKENQLAFDVLEEFRKTQQVAKLDYEYCELVLYQATILKEAGNFKEALDHLNKHEKQIVDRLCLEELRGELLRATNATDKAVGIYNDLLERNPENWSYYKALEDCVKPASEDDRLQIYRDTLSRHPRATAPKRLPLDFATGSNFKQLADDYLVNSLRKGVPSLFVSLKSVYRDRCKVTVIEEMLLDYEGNLSSGQCFHLEDQGQEPEPPTSLLWTRTFLAQHFDYLGQSKRALEYADLIASETPTLPEAFLLKGKIYKHAGHEREAVRWLDEAQSLDTADRYINCKCAKAMLRASMVKEAEAMCSNFTREGVAAMDNLNEMQCMWFQTECAKAYQRLSLYGEALKKCLEIDHHFGEIIEDQFDFHTYCLRKMTLNAYVCLLRLEDVLRCHRFFFKAAKTAIEIYLHLHSHPLSDEQEDGEVNDENLTPSELKKLRNKQRKAQKKAAQDKHKQDEERKASGTAPASAANAPNPAKKSSHTDEADHCKEEDLSPDKLARVADPLDQAIRFLKPLQDLCSDNIETHILAFEIYSRKGKLLLMLQAIKRGCRIHAVTNSPRFHLCIVKFLRRVQEAADVPDAVKALLTKELTTIYNCYPIDNEKQCWSPELDSVQSRLPENWQQRASWTGAAEGLNIKDDICPEFLNLLFFKRHSKSVPHRLAVAMSMAFLSHTACESALTIATNLSDDLEGRTVENCAAVFEALKQGHFGESEYGVEAYKQACHAFLPYASMFTPNDHPVTNGPPLPPEVEYE